MPYPPDIRFANDASNFEMPEDMFFRIGYRFNGLTIPLSSAFSASFVPSARRDRAHVGVVSKSTVPVLSHRHIVVKSLPTNPNRSKLQALRGVEVGRLELVPRRFFRE
jgi:hypothetical protein